MTKAPSPAHSPVGSEGGHSAEETFANAEALTSEAVEAKQAVVDPASERAVRAARQLKAANILPVWPGPVAKKIPTEQQVKPDDCAQSLEFDYFGLPIPKLWRPVWAGTSEANMVATCLSPIGGGVGP